MHCHKMSSIIERSDGSLVIGPYYYDGLTGSFDYDLANSFDRDSAC